MGQVLIAQANFMRVLVHPAELTVSERETRAAQLAQARARAASAGQPCSVPEDLDLTKPTVLLCNVRALLKKIKQRVLVGDRVRLIGVDWVDQRAMIEEVLPRSSELENPAIANVSQVLLVFAMEDPPLEPHNLSRFLVAAEAAELPFHVALNKCDLADEAQRGLVREFLAGWGYTPHFFSVATGEGLAELASVLTDNITVVAGPSGVGKSSLINRLYLQGDTLSGAEARALLGQRWGDDEAAEEEAAAAAAAAAVAAAAADGEWGSFDTGTDILGSGGGGAGKHTVEGNNAVKEVSADMIQSVASVSARTGRGRHTTRHVTLLQLPTYGLLADTPGFNQPALEKLTLAQLPECFPEIAMQAARGVVHPGWDEEYAALTQDDDADDADDAEGAAAASVAPSDGATVSDAGSSSGSEEEEEEEDAAERRWAEPPAGATAWAGGEAAPVATCAFSNCTHRHEPGCVVRGDWERYVHYLDLYDEIETRERKEREKKQANLAVRNEADHVKAKSGGKGKVRMEAKLETKRHRRTNRRQVNMQLMDMATDFEDDEEDEFGDY